MIRTLNSALGESLQIDVGLNHPSVPWIVRHAGELTSSFRIRKDWRRAVHKAKGCDPCKPIVEVCELVQFMPWKSSKEGTNFAYQWFEGIRLGTFVRSGENTIAARDDWIYRFGVTARRP